jgi:coenzyme F420-reducing hydrogenase alpha subunit
MLTRRHLGDRRITARYDRRMATQKVSVTLGAEAIHQARQAAGPRGLSSYLDAALREKLERDERRGALLALLEELETADPTPAEVRARASRRAHRIRQAVNG